ncbi:MAG: hypothetical protein S4CHLAM6_15880 [Chlamydiae bacterium]|nr:hypothetical protein [Chlamydiota bacterium]
MRWISRFLWFCFFCATFLSLSTLLSKKTSQKTYKKTPKEFVSEENSVQSISQNFENLGEGILGSKSQRVKKALQESIKYLGSNSRPDYSAPVLFCSFQNQAWTFNAHKINELSMFSDDHTLKDYSFKVRAKQEQAFFDIFYKGSPSFNLSTPCTNISKPALIDNYKLDSYILVRQKVSWLGQDQFLKEYGGDDFLFAQESQRLDFLHQKPPYFIFAKQGDLFSWKDGRWYEAGQDSQDYPLMQVGKIDGQVMNLSIWDTSGRHKEQIQLSRSQSGAKKQNIVPLRYIGAKSAQKWLVKSNKERFVIEPGDWMVHLGYKWEKMDSLGSINRYINNLNIGELFVIKDLIEKDGKKLLVGELFNAARTEKIDYQIDLSAQIKSLK